MILLTFNITDSTHFLKNKLKVADEKLIKIIEKNTESVLRTLENYEVSATFFIAENLVDPLGNLIKQIYRQRHEIALFAQNKNSEDLLSARDKISSYIGKSVKGIRTPEGYFSPVEIEQMGFSYISPIEKMKLTYLFRRLERKTGIYSENNVQIISESISPYTQIPYNETVFQYIPMKYYSSMVSETLKTEDYVLIYLNMLQFTDFELNKLNLSFLRKYNTGAEMQDKLELLLNYINENDLAASLMKDYLP